MEYILVKHHSLKNKYLSTSVAYIVICIISLFMAGYNYFDNKLPHMTVAFVFAGFCFINYILSLFGKVCNKIAEILFAVEAVFLCIYLIIGSAGSTGVMWICLLPVCGVLFFGLKKTIWLCAAVLSVMLLFFFYPDDRSLTIHFYPISLRFRILFFFIAFSAISFFLETKRKATQNELIALQEKYHDLYLHDALTSVYNRHAFNEILNNEISFEDNVFFGFILIDIDYFKEINDTLGHYTGDLLLIETADIITRQTNEKVFRWGGDEFAVFLKNANEVKNTAEKICRAFETEIKENDNFGINATVSIGAISVCSSAFSSSEILKAADKCLYQAKNQGRNRVIYKKITL